ncbi:MAG: hypothetical protein A2Y91_03100 [Chloroflexi bacterium RBG_13_54_8]|nr:MAG: hypothetical protein A2Y91_03100 [Chloroflexi bacterium RBG_13_54_8]
METSHNGNQSKTPRKHFTTDLRALRKEVEIRTYRAAGPGGQRRDKKQTAVRLTHIPSGITVVASERRSQATNLETAFERLRAKLVRLNRPRRRRIETKPSPSALEKRVEQKRQQSEKKKSRQMSDIAGDIEP